VTENAKTITKRDQGFLVCRNFTQNVQFETNISHICCCKICAVNMLILCMVSALILIGLNAALHPACSEEGKGKHVVQF